MSKNFELLQQAVRGPEVFESNTPHTTPRQEFFEIGTPPTRPQNGRGNGLSLHSLGREEIIKLVRRVFGASRSNVPKTVVFSGVETGAGCSWVCACASKILAAQAKERVCMVDANLHTPYLHRYFGVDNVPGLTEALLQSGPLVSYAQSIGRDNLWLLPSGNTRGNISALMTSKALQSRMMELRAQFEYVLIDSPPINAYADATLLGQLADGAILVLESSRTRREAALKAKQNVEAANVPLLGIVLNKRTYPIPDLVYRLL